MSTYLLIYHLRYYTEFDIQRNFTLVEPLDNWRITLGVTSGVPSGVPSGVTSGVTFGVTSGDLWCGVVRPLV
jgi:hypothetical protein